MKYQEKNKLIGGNIRNIRLKRSMTLDELAIKTKVSKNYLIVEPTDLIE